MRHFKVNAKDYALFDYSPYLDGQSNVIPRPKKVKYDLGDVVYIRPSNSIGVVLGCIDHDCEELRTDMEGMVPFSDIEFAKKEHFGTQGVSVQKELAIELGINL